MFCIEKRSSLFQFCRQKVLPRLPTARDKEESAGDTKNSISQLPTSFLLKRLPDVEIFTKFCKANVLHMPFFFVEIWELPDVENFHRNDEEKCLSFASKFLNILGKIWSARCLIFPKND